MKPSILALRGNWVENRHQAQAVLVGMTEGQLQKFPETMQGPVFLRSAAKPFQAYPLYQHPESDMLSLAEWAIICASHAARPEQLALVLTVLEKAEATVADLGCGPHLPLDSLAAKTLQCQGQSPTALHNNCSGKHAGMLLACRLYGWPLQGYLDLAHPLQQKILSTVQTASQCPDIAIAVDGCGAPVFAMPMLYAGRLFAVLARHPDFSGLVNAMTTHPRIVGDPTRIDTRLMEISNGQLVAKVGADGFLGIGHRQHAQGLAIKVLDGSNTIRDRLAIAVLHDLGWLPDPAAETLWAEPAFSRNRYNTNQQVIGEYEFNFAWQT